MARSFNYSGTFTKTRKKRPGTVKDKTLSFKSKGSKNYVKPYHDKVDNSIIFIKK